MLIQTIHSRICTIIAGFDSFDPGVFEALHESGRTPNPSKLLDAGGYSPLEVCSPPQTDVSRTGIATGVDPGSHGLFYDEHLGQPYIKPHRKSGPRGRRTSRKG